MASVIDTLVTNRTEVEDTSYNISDLNRVGQAVVYIRNRFNEYGYSVNVEPKLNWEITDYPTTENTAKYLQDVIAIKSVLPLYPTTPPLPVDLVGFTFKEANNIEKIVFDVNSVLNDIRDSFKVSGAFYTISGATIGFPVRRVVTGPRNWGELDKMKTTWRNWQVTTWYGLQYSNLKYEGDVP